jgi:hypothetical protein
MMKLGPHLDEKGPRMIKLPQRAVILVAVLIFSTACFAQVSYPERPIRMLVHLHPAAAPISWGAVLAQQMTSALGQSGRG